MLRCCVVNYLMVCIWYKVFNDGYWYDDSLCFVEDYLFWIELVLYGYIFCNFKDKLFKFCRVGDFYKCCGFVKLFNEFRVWFRVLRKFKCMFLYNLFYVILVLILRLMFVSIVKLVYKFDCYYLEKFIKYWCFLVLLFFII